MRDKFVIRRCESSDRVTAERLHVLATRTFIEAYEWGVSHAILQNYVETRFAIDAIEKDLKRPDTAFFFAEAQGVLVGYLKIIERAGVGGTFNPEMAYLERSYILKTHQGQGIGKALLEAGLDWARIQSLKRVWLRTWVKNGSAIAFFRRNGFERTGTTVFEFELPEGGTHLHENDVMERVL